MAKTLKNFLDTGADRWPELVDADDEWLDRLDPGMVVTVSALMSIAISLRRIADHLRNVERD